MKHRTIQPLLVVLLSVILLSATLKAAPSTNPESSPRGYHLSDHYLVSYTGTEAAFRLEMRILGCRVDEIWKGIQVARVSGIEAGQVASMLESSGIGALARDVCISWVNTLSQDMNVRVQAAQDNTAHASPSDAEFFEIQWGLQQIDITEAWSITRGDRSVRVGILDTGISPDHVDLAGKYDLAASINLSASNPGDKRDYIDRHFHGTHVSALIASNNLGVASVAPAATLVGIKVLNDEGHASFANLIAGIMYAVDVAEVDIINLSVGGVGTIDQIAKLSEMLHAAVDYAERHGVVVIASAGNETTDLYTDALVNFIVADEAGTILVSATGPENRSGSEALACYSNYGEGLIGLAAPGGSIDCSEESFASMTDMVLSAMAPAVARRLGLKNPEGWYMFATGTSMAAPMVSGVAALVKSVNPGLDPAGICEKMQASADDLGSPGVDKSFGYGRVNAANALR